MMKKYLLFIFFITTFISIAQVSLVKDINPGSGDGVATYTITRLEYNGSLLFAAGTTLNDFELWKSDGTTTGTNLVSTLNFSGGSYPNGFIYFSSIDKVIFSANNYPTGGSQQNYEPYITDGTTAGTQQLVEVLGSGSNGSVPLYFTEFNNKIYFSAIGTSISRELFVLDGTPNYTLLIKDINAGSPNSFPNDFRVFNNLLYFTAEDNINGRELWKTDGTTAGTVLVTDLNPGNTFSSPQELTVYNNELYFSADNGTNGRELFKVNTLGNVVIVSDIYTGINSSNPNKLFVYNNKLYFTADNGADGTELWVTYEGAISNKSSMATVTEMVKNINPASGSSSPFGFTEFNGSLYFAADDGSNGIELWVTNGTKAGTTLLKDINTSPSSPDSNPNEIIEYFGELYFAANDGVNGRELWKTDGTNAGTVLVSDINTSGDSNPTDLIVANNLLFFSADNGSTGNELWKYQDPSLSFNEVELENSISLFPNPTNSSFSIVTKYQINNISVIDLQGKTVKSFKENLTLYDIEDLTSGLYFIKIKTEKGEITKKLIKQ